MKVQWSLRVEEDLFEKIKEISVAEVRSLNNTLEWLLVKAVENYEGKDCACNAVLPEKPR